MAVYLLMKIKPMTKQNATEGKTKNTLRKSVNTTHRNTKFHSQVQVSQKNKKKL
jgi:hypothetical protein